MARKIGSRYTAHQILGRGSAGTVWLGEGPEGAVAIKLLREELAADQELVGRFVQERAALLGLADPHVVGVRDLVVDGNDLALVMELVRGTDLRTRLERERRLAPRRPSRSPPTSPTGSPPRTPPGSCTATSSPRTSCWTCRARSDPAARTPRCSPTSASPGSSTPRAAPSPSPRPGDHRPAALVQGHRHPDYLAPEIIEGLPPRASVDVYALATVLYELLAGFTPFGGGHPGAVLRRHVTESVVPLPGIPDELWQLLLQCLAKAPASRLRAPELAARLRELLPSLEGMPPLDIDEPDDEQPDDEPEGAAGARDEAFHPSPAPGGTTPPRGAVPLVQGAAPDSNRDTHTSMRVPGPDELAGGAHGTARTPRAAGERRAGSARHRASPEAVRRRRIRWGAAAAAVVVAAGLGGWLASGDDGAGDATPGVHRSGPDTPDGSGVAP